MTDQRSPLATYGRHLASCKKDDYVDPARGWQRGTGTCTCGFSAALAADTARRARLEGIKQEIQFHLQHGTGAQRATLESWAMALGEAIRGEA